MYKRTMASTGMSEAGFFAGATGTPFLLVLLVFVCDVPSGVETRVHVGADVSRIVDAAHDYIPDLG